MINKRGFDFSQPAKKLGRPFLFQEVDWFLLKELNENWHAPTSILGIGMLCGGTPLAGIHIVSGSSISPNSIPVNRSKVVFLVVFLIFFYVQPKK